MNIRLDGKRTPITGGIPASAKLLRIGEPEDVARMEVVLVSDVASSVTSRIVSADRGMTDYPDFEHSA